MGIGFKWLSNLYSLNIEDYQRRINKTCITIESSLVEIPIDHIIKMFMKSHNLENVNLEELRQLNEANNEKTKDPIIYLKYDNYVVVLKQVGNLPQEKLLMDYLSKLNKKTILDKL